MWISLMVKIGLIQEETISVNKTPKTPTVRFSANSRPRISFFTEVVCWWTEDSSPAHSASQLGISTPPPPPLLLLFLLLLLLLVQTPGLKSFRGILAKTANQDVGERSGQQVGEECAGLALLKRQRRTKMNINHTKRPQKQTINKHK